MPNIKTLNIGESLSSVQLEPVSRLDLIKYAGASGDYNPIHTIDKAAENAGLPGIIAHGMWTMGNLSQLFTPFFEEGFVQTFTTRFSEMVFLDDVVTLHAQLRDKEQDALHFDVKAVKQNDKTAIKGSVTFQLFDEVQKV